MSIASFIVLWEMSGLNECRYSKYPLLGDLLPIAGEQKVAIKVSHSEKVNLNQYIYFMLMLLVWTDLVCRLPRSYI